MQNNKRNFTLLLSASMLIVAALYALDKKQFTRLVSQESEEVSITHKRQSTDRSKFLFDEYGNLCQPLISLLELTDIQHNGTLANIVEQTQQKWLRASGKERWEINELYPEKRAAILALLDDLGSVAEVKPTHMHYDYAVLLGATIQRVRMRLQYLIDLHTHGVQFKKIIVLGGERPLDATLEHKDVLLNTQNGILPCKPNWKLQGSLPTTEMQMMQLVYDQTELPETMCDIPVTFINTPMITLANGTIRRPGFGETIQTWLSHNPEEGSCLIISNNPFIGYADSVVRTYMPHDFTIETVGSAASDETKLSVHLDNCARWLYQEKVRREKSI